ncbi:MAG: MaoC family dehydratase [Sporichthyaceae bacterium]
MRTFENVDDFIAAAGTELGASDWLTIDQKRIDAFAEATGDFQWIHVDPERAAAGPFRTTIAHGLLTLGLYGGLIGTIYELKGIKMGVNYGLNKVRFPSPVPVDSEVRLVLSLGEVTRLDGAVQATMPGVIEIRGGAKPACVLEGVVRYVL